MSIERSTYRSQDQPLWIRPAAYFGGVLDTSGDFDAAFHALHPDIKEHISPSR